MEYEQTKSLFRRLIQIPSVTGSLFEETACALLEEVLDSYKIAHERITEDPKRPNLLAYLPSSSREKNAPLVLISHVDVVKGDQDQWQFPVFSGESINGRICGRGTLDTKQLTMMQLAAFTALADKNLCRDVYFLATIDEEGGSCYGMESVSRQRPALFKNAVVLNEGGGFPVFVDGKPYMTVTVGEKSIFKIRISAKGTGGHASVPTDDQAVVKLAAALETLFRQPCELTSGSRLVADRIESIVSGKLTDSAADKIYEYARDSSISMRNWQIGQRVNVLPSSAACIVEIKTRPHTDPGEVEEYMKQRLSGTSCSFEIISQEDGFQSDPDQTMLQLLLDGAQNAGHKFPIFPMLALGRTDGRFFGSAGSKVFGCSPCIEEDSFDKVLSMVHGTDESIAEESFKFGCQVLGYAIEKYCIKENSN